MDIRSDRGFILIEVAIALVVMGTILGIFIPTVNMLRSCSAVHQDQQKYERICCAIAAYVMRNFHLPAPALDSESGESDFEVSKSINVGFVPFKTIGLSKEHSVNSKGKPIKYVPNRILTETTILYKHDGNNLDLEGGNVEFCSKFSADSIDLDVIDIQNRSVIDTQSNHDAVNPIAFVLFVEDRNIQVNSEEVIKVKILNNPASIRYVFRDELMAYYARCPCRPI